VLNLGADLLHLQPRGEHARLRRASTYSARPAGNSLNEQHARAQLHALNEADIDMPPGEARETGVAPIDMPLTMHWTRILHHDLYGANDDMAQEPATAGATSGHMTRGDGTAGMFRRAVARLAGRMLGWMAA